MTIRTSRGTAVFNQPFELDGFGPQPAGEYRLDTDEELLEGLSFLAYRRVGALLYLPAIGASRGTVQVVTLLPAMLDAMLERDRTQVPHEARPDARECTEPL